MRTYLYLRARHRSERLEFQERRLRSFARREGHSVAGVFSGERDGAPVRLVEAVLGSGSAAVLIATAGGGANSTAWLAGLCEALMPVGVAIISADGRFDTRTPTGALTAAMLAGTALVRLEPLGDGGGLWGEGAVLLPTSR